MQNSFVKACMMMIISFLYLTNSQNICQNCLSVANNTYNFTCNNIFCEGFVIPYNDQYIFNASAVMCNQANGANGGSNCFYPMNTTSQSVSVTYFFCNASIIGCAACTNQFVCSTCFNGYYIYALNSSVANCQLCSNSIPGCFYCSSQSQCTQCFPGYVLYGNTCMYLNGTMPNGIGLFTYQKGGSAVAQIIGAVFIFFILVIVLAAVWVFFCKQKKQIPDFLNPNLNQSSMQETLPF